MPVALTIAGSDSGGGAGVVADLMTFAAHHVFGAVAVAAITAQNTREVRAVKPVAAELLSAQITAVLTDLAPAAVKIGMLGNASNATAVATTLRKFKVRQVVLDPVMLSKTGARLLDRSGVAVLKKKLLPLALLVTPNLPETEILAGFPLRDAGDRRLAAEAIADMGAGAVLIKGGHSQDHEIVDLLFDGKKFLEFRTFRIDTQATHGTGCTLSSAIAANLARGVALTDAVRNGIEYLRRGLKRGLFPGSGYGCPGHF